MAAVLHDLMAMRVLSPLVHAMLDYPVALLLMALPNIGGFASLAGPAVTVPRALGVALLLYSVLTRYELSAFRIVPLRMHLAMDVLVAALLALSPFVFGFYSTTPARVWSLHIATAVGVLALALTTHVLRHQVSVRHHG